MSVVPRQESEAPGVAEEAAEAIVAVVLAYRDHLEDAEWREALALVIAALQREQGRNNDETPALSSVAPGRA